jgi:hypothetical protein
MDFIVSKKFLTLKKEEFIAHHRKSQGLFQASGAETAQRNLHPFFHTHPL